MNQIRKLTMPVVSQVEKILNRALDNVYLNTALKVFLVLYAALAAPKFPPRLAFLMDNIFVRIGISFLIVFMALRDPGLALVIAVAFIITLQTANKLKLINTDLSQALPGETSWLPSAQKEGFANTDDEGLAEGEKDDKCEECAELIKSGSCNLTPPEDAPAKDAARDAQDAQDAQDPQDV